jgi:serine protease Do
MCSARVVAVICVVAGGARADSLSELVERLRPAVVNVQAIHGVPASPGGAAAHVSSRSLGSGFVIDPRGVIVTNAHVVDDASTVRVVTYDQRDYRARVVGRDKRSDLAVLELDGASDLPTVSLGSSDDLRVGDPVFAIGNPFGLGSSVTAGILSAKERNLGGGAYEEMLQTDAPINPGNSGGPLFDDEGRVIGISTAILETGQGIGFAIPIELARDVVEQLRKNGVVERGWIGVEIQDVTPGLSRAFHAPSGTGALVASVDPDGPAAHAGVKVGDVIVEFDDRTIGDAARLPRYVASARPGTQAAVAFLRDGDRHVKVVDVKELPDGGAPPPAAPKPKALPGLGLGVAAKDGTLVIDSIDPASPAVGALSVGDTVLDVDRRPVRSKDELAAVVSGHRGPSPLLVRIKRGELTVFIPIDP